MSTSGSTLALNTPICEDTRNSGTWALKIVLAELRDPDIVPNHLTIFCFFWSTLATILLPMRFKKLASLMRASTNLVLVPVMRPISLLDFKEVTRLGLYNPPRFPSESLGYSRAINIYRILSKSKPITPNISPFFSSHLRPKYPPYLAEKMPAAHLGPLVGNQWHQFSRHTGLIYYEHVTTQE